MPVEAQVLRRFAPNAGPVGPSGPTGPPGSPDPVELYDSNTPPVSPAFPYLRFARDMAGDVQTIYLGTAT